MPDITVKRNGELLRTLFDMLQQHPDGMPPSQALKALANTVQLTPFEAGTYESGDRRFERIVRFATVDCVKAGWMLKEKGRWTLTEAGKQAYQTYRTPDDFARQAGRLYRQWKASQPGASAAATILPEQEDLVQKNVSITYEQAEEQAWQEIEQYLRTMNPYDFQELVASLLKAMGYHIAWVSPPGKDGGIDIEAWTDPLGTRAPRIKVQVKRIGQSVTVTDLRALIALVGDDEVGLFVTTSKFTKDAEDEARRQARRKITLIDLERLFNLWVEHYDRLEDHARRRLPLQPIYFLAPNT